MQQIWVRQRGTAAWLPHVSPALDVTDRGFLYGDGLFETIRVKGGSPQHVESHLSRLWKSQLELGFELEPGLLNEMRISIRESIRRNGICMDGVVKVILSRGIGARGFAPPVPCEPTVVISGTHYVPPTPLAYNSGIAAIICSQPVFSASMAVRHKTLSGLDKVMARLEALRAGAEEGLLQNENGILTEATSANVFVIQDEVILTSPISAGLLPGVTRQNVMKLCRELGYHVVETPIAVGDLQKADEVWMTNAVIGIMRVRKIEHVRDYASMNIYQAVREHFEKGDI